MSETGWSGIARVKKGDFVRIAGWRQNGDDYEVSGHAVFDASRASWGGHVLLLRTASGATLRVRQYGVTGGIKVNRKHGTGEATILLDGNVEEIGR